MFLPQYIVYLLQISLFIYFLQSVFTLCDNDFVIYFESAERQRSTAVQMEVSMKELRQLIRDLREDHDLTQREVAAHLGVSQQTYSNYENGVREIPTNTVVALARFYKVSTDYLLNSNSGYLGNTNLNSTYLDETTLHDIMYDIQGLDEDARKELLRFIRFLGHTD